MYYNKQGKKIERTEWHKLWEDKEYKIIKQKTLPDGKCILTIWFGVSWYKEKILIFETMVFPKERNFHAIEGVRYSTLQEAEKGHKKMVKKYEKREMD